MSFTIDIDTEIEDELYGDETNVTVCLKLVVSGTTIEFRPESNYFVEMDVGADSASMDTCGSNGSFSLAWNKVSIRLECSKYGSGGGGTLAVEIQSTPEAMESLRTCLCKWKTALKQ